MEIKRFNNINESNTYQAISKYKGFEKDYDHLQYKIVKEIEDIIKENESEIIFSTSIDVKDPNSDDGSSCSAKSIDNEGWVVTENDYDADEHSFGLNDFSIDDLLKIMRAINDVSEYTYRVQKRIIEENPKKIPTIIDKLNPKIKKEYPHLGSGKELNLL
jgi:hypothetical protein